MYKTLKSKKGRTFRYNDNGVFEEMLKSEKNPKDNKMIFFSKNGSSYTTKNMPSNIRMYENAEVLEKRTGIKVVGKHPASKRNNSKRNNSKRNNSNVNIIPEGIINKGVYDVINNNEYAKYFRKTPAPKRSDLAAKKTGTNQSTKTTDKTTAPKTTANNNVIRKDNISSTTTQPKTAKTNTKTNTTTKSTNAHVTQFTPASKRSSRINSSRVSSSTPNGNYTVNKGDSLWRIAHNAGISLNELMRQNPQIKNINQIIRPGDKINVSGKSNTTSTNTSTSEPSTTTPSTPKYENIIFDDTKLAPAISTDLVGVPDKIEPIKYNYKKKKR